MPYSMNIRDFPDDLLKALKIKAVSEGKTLREVVIEILQKAIKKK